MAFRSPRNWGKLLLGIWLIAMGLSSVFTIPIPQFGLILAVLAIVAGILIIMDR